MKAYILKLSFEDISPLIWRRVILPADATFNRLHETIQYVTNFQSGQSPYHSFAVEVGDTYITNNASILDEYKGKKYAGKAVKQPVRMKIDSFLQKHGSFIYNYDFGDDWKIRVILEETVEDYYFGYPTLLDGEEMAPPEDVGGPSGFESFKNIVGDSTHPDHHTTVEWANRQSYIPLDLDLVNERLKDVKYKKTEWEFIDHENYVVKSDKYRGSVPLECNPLSSNELLVQYAIACTNFYGYINNPKFLEIYNKHNEPAVSRDELEAIITEPNIVERLKKDDVYVQSEAFVHNELVAQGKNLSEFLQKTKGKPYYVPEKEELLRYIDKAYYEQTSFQEQLMMKVANDFFGGSTIMVKGILDGLIGRLHTTENNYQSVTQQFIKRFKMKDMQQMNEYAYMIMMMANNTRIWENRGHTPSELFELEKLHLQSITYSVPNSISDKKIGRNDPCLCGSGKKYKKCCAK